MLKSDKKIISQVLRKLYAGYNHFNIKDDSILFSKRWFSLKQHTTSLKELAVDTIPTVISGYSEVDSADYQSTVNQMFLNKVSQTDIINYINATFSKFLKTYQFKGISPITNQVIALKFKTIKKALRETAIAKIFSNFVLHVKNDVKPLAKEKIVSIEEKVNQSLQYTAQVVGRVCTGNSELDAKYRTIVRYLSPEAGIYCI